MYESLDAYYQDRTKPLQSERGLLADAGVGIAGGVVEGVEGILELPNLIPGVDYDLGVREALGIAKTERWSGALTEVFSQLAVGFGTVGAAAKVAKATRAGAAVAQAASARVPAALQNSTIAKNAFKGAAAEFAAFSGAESNFSNMLRDEFGLEIGDYLALEEDDGEFSRRLKTTLEGAGLGVIADGVFKLVGGMRKIRKLNEQRQRQAATEGADEATAAIDDEAERIVEQEIQPALDELQSTPITDVEREIDAVSRSLVDIVDDQPQLQERLRQKLYAPGRELGIPDDVLDRQANENWKAYTTGQVLADAVDQFGTPYRNGQPVKRAINPSVVETRDFSVLVAATAQNPKLVAAFRNRKTWGESLAEAHKFAEKTGYDGQAIYNRMKQYAKSAEEAEVLYVAAVGDTHRLLREWSSLNAIARNNDPQTIGQWTKKNWGVEMTQVEFETVVSQRFRMLQEAQYFLYKGKSATARHLQKMRMPVTKVRAYHAARLAMKAADPERAAAGRDFHEELLTRWGNEQGMMRREKQFANASEELRELELMKQSQDHLGLLMEGGDLTGAARAALAAVEAPDSLVMRYWMFSLLSGVKTMSAALMGSFATRAIHPIERAIGMRALGGVDKRIRQSTLNEMSSLWQLGAFRDAFVRSWKRDNPVFHGRTSLRNLGFDVASNANKSKLRKYGSDTLDVFRRMLVSMDEATKVVQSNKILTTRFLREGIEEGLSGQALTDHIEKRLALALKDDILLTRDSVMTRAVQDTFTRYGDDISAMNPELFDLEVQRRSVELLNDEQAVAVMNQTEMVGSEVSKLTFTNKMAEDTAFTKFGQTAREFVNKVPAAKFITPFITAPVNMLDYARRRVALPVVNPEFWGQSVGMLNTLVKRVSGNEIPARYREPLAKFQRASETFTAELNSKDPDVAAAAMGRAIFGLASTAAVASAYSAGVLTGSGPADKRLRRAMEAEGWQPFSFRIPNWAGKAAGFVGADAADDGYTYISLTRIEPVGSIVSLVAEICETLDHADDEIAGEGTTERIVSGAQAFASGVVSVFAQNALSKSYLAGVDAFIEALGDESKVASFVSRIAANVVPGAIAQFRDVVGDTPVSVAADYGMFRQIIERTAARIPMGQDAYRDVANGFGLPGLAMRYNFMGEPMERTLGSSVAGETISRGFQFSFGIKFNTTRDETIMREMALLEHPIAPPRPKLGGVDLRAVMAQDGNSAYDRYMELTGQVRIDGKTMREALVQKINSRDYRKLAEAGIDDLSEDSPRVRELDAVVSEFRAEAQRRLEQELPELRGLLATRMAVRQALREGKSAESVRAKFSILEGGR